AAGPGPGRPAAPPAQEAREERPGAAPGRKGKRLVQIQADGGDQRAKKGALGRRLSGEDVGLDEVVEIAGHFPVAGLKMRRQRRMTAGGKKKKAQLPAAEIAPPKAIKRRIKVPETISVGDLARRMGIKASELIAKLLEMGVFATVNQALDVDTATIVAADFGYEVEKGYFEEETVLGPEAEEGGGEVLPRPPVVTVMGHVDHGKTSILDAIRKTDVAAGEAGGITQHIGAHYVRSSAGDVVFLDTPGHAAFTAMRARGAQVTDVVVLVVAADDGVMDQTREAINHAQAAKVPIVVAVNKIDKPNADPMRVKRELSDLGLMPEEWGGSAIYCECSAKKNVGINELVENILLQAEVLDLKADPTRRARGHVLEAKLDKGRGAVATVLVQQGTLRPGDAFVCGTVFGKVRSLFSDKGEALAEAGPSMPVEVQGFSGVAQAGDEFIVLADEKTAKQVGLHRQMKARETELAATNKISLDKLFERMSQGEVKELLVILRADVQGTLEAFGEAIQKLSTDAIKVRVLHGGTGAITDTDIMLASASNAVIIGFNVRPSSKVMELAQRESVDIRFYDVIYHAIEDIRKAMVGMLEPTYVEKVVGGAEVRQTFNVPKVGTIAGCYVTSGKVERSNRVRLVRDGVVVYTGRLASLKRFKDDVREVATGYECGVHLESYNDIKVGDVLELFVLDEVAAQL
ncbi:MAG: translation initiation factor IF-2, partial [Thermodesulfobacteriota bacterium]